MSVGIIEKQVLYDTPYAPIVKFSYSINTDEDEEEDMTDDQISTQSNLEHSFKAFSLEDLVKSFDNTINACFPDQSIIESKEKSLNTDLISTSNTWSDLIENLRTSLCHDLKLPNISENCQKVMNNIYENDLISIDDLNEDEEEDLREKLDMHSIILSSNSFLHQPFLTAEQVIDEIDFMLKDMTPDSGYGDNLHISYIQSDLKTQSIYSLNELIDDLNRSIKDLSNVLVQELDNRDEFEYEKEAKNTFISFVLSIQNKRQHYQNKKRRSIIGNNNSIEPGTYLTTVIPFDPSKYLSVDYLQNLNKILHAINEDSPQVPELLTNYILKVLCPC